MFRFIWTIKCVEHTTVPGGDTLSCSRPAQEWTPWILVVNIMYISILLSKPQILFVTFFRVYCWYLPVYNSRGLHYRFLFIHGCLFYCYIKQPEISFSFLLSFFFKCTQTPDVTCTCILSVVTIKNTKIFGHILGYINQSNAYVGNTCRWQTQTLKVIWANRIKFRLKAKIYTDIYAVWWGV